MLQPLILNEILSKIPKVQFEWEIYFFKRKVYSVEGKDLDIDKKKEAIRDFFSIRVIKDKKSRIYKLF